MLVPKGRLGSGLFLGQFSNMILSFSSGKYLSNELYNFQKWMWVQCCGRRNNTMLLFRQYSKSSRSMSNVCSSTKHIIVPFADQNSVSMNHGSWIMSHNIMGNRWPSIFFFWGLLLFCSSAYSWSTRSAYSWSTRSAFMPTSSGES